MVYLTAWLVLDTKRLSGVPQKINKIKSEENTKSACTYLQRPVEVSIAPFAKSGISLTPFLD
jgi:hypothetical protein